MQDKVWVTRDGQMLLVANMATSHIINCIAMIERQKNWRREYLERLRLELLIRDDRERK